MSIIEQIKAEIERRRKSLRAGICNDEAFTRKQKNEMLVASEELDRLNRFLSTLESEKPMNLEEEINRYLREEYSNDDEPGVHEIAEHFAQWQRQQMMKEAVPFYEILKAVPPGPERENVRIIIVKEDSHE